MHPDPSDARLAALLSTYLLYSEPEPAFDRLTLVDAGDTHEPCIVNATAKPRSWVKSSNSTPATQSAQLTSQM